ncbi:hypothetical protein B0G57_11262 [Trinickia symbiotica]|uniref:Uncharacterized protein n=1 Tax=Trinickia symbiotica TaxID=863227 RepID=A0A2N7X0B9_9BURK|nr:hypothetical protein [Trinickia symbiotica]PMS35021.1 hypothetical protein C0Z20_19925 [Trinickia symbiotica]PPK43515.1 hypothetical protein B0G57_11262 [Trinickia symbiotica]
MSTNKWREGARLGKRLWLGAFVRGWRVFPVYAAIALTACGNRGGSEEAQTTTQASESTPMLPGARAGLLQDAGHAASGSLAQGFGTPPGPGQTPASNPLLPPVMHSAD